MTNRLSRRHSSSRRRFTLDIHDLVESHEFQHSAYYGRRRQDDKPAAERRSVVVGVQDRTRARRIHEFEAAKVEAELVAVSVERAIDRPSKTEAVATSNSPLTKRVRVDPDR